MKKKPFMLALMQSALVLTLLVAAPLAASAESASSQRADWNTLNGTQMTTDRVTEVTDADAALRDSVQRAMDSYSSVKVDAETGTVTLTGTVSSQAERDAAIQRARSISGVKAVKSELRVE